MPQQRFVSRKRSHYPRTERAKPTHTTTVALPERERSNPQPTLVREQKSKEKKINQKGERFTQHKNALLPRTQELSQERGEAT